MVSLFKISRIAEKISAVVTYFLNTKPGHTKAFVAILITSLCQKHVDWNRVVQWLRIDEASLRQDISTSPVFDFMAGRREWYKFTSTQLADHIFRNYDLDDALVVDVYTKIVRETAYSANDSRSGFDARENLKELMKFRFLTRIFGEGADGRAAIGAIYERLSSVDRIRANDQFWLQYAMSCLEFDNVLDAEKYLNTAFGLAGAKGEDYSDYQIRDQRARLSFVKFAITDAEIDWSQIDQAMGDIVDLIGRDDSHSIHPFRCSEYILRFLEARIDELKPEWRVKITHLLELMQGELPKRLHAKAKRGEMELLKRHVQKGILVLKNA